MAKPQGQCGKTWDELRKMPGELMRLVVMGKATVVGKDKRGRKLYVLHEDT